MVFLNKAFIIFFVLIINFCFSQNITEGYVRKFPGVNAVCQNFEQIVSIDIIKGQLIIISDFYEKTIHLSEQSRFNARKSIHHSSFSKLDKFEAFSIFLDGKKQKKIKVKDFLDVFSEEDGIFFHDFLERKFVFPMVEKGTTTVLKYSKIYLEPRLTPSFFFYKSVPTEEMKFTLKINKNIDIAYKLFNSEDYDIEYSVSEIGKFNEHIWLLKNYKPKIFFNDMPGFSYFVPHVNFHIKSYQLKNETIPIFPDLKHLNNWYWQLTHDIREFENVEFKELTQTILKDITDEEEKAEKLFDWVLHNIRYVAFADSIRGFKPNHPAAILKNRYGDCKDMSVLLHTLLHNAGIKSYLTWIGTRLKSYSYEDVPNTTADNHMIVAFKPPNKETIFLDPTARYSLFGIPPSSIQSKEALISLNEWNYLVEKVPIMSEQLNFFLDSCTYIIDNNQLIGKGKGIVDGYVKEDAYYSLIGRTQEQQDRHMRSLLKRGGLKYHINSYSLENLNNKKKPLVVNYNLTIDDYIKINNDEIFVNMNLDRIYDNQVIDINKREVPIENEYYFSGYTYSKLEIPIGYFVNYMPENRKFENENFGFEISYAIEDNSLIYVKKMYIKFLLLYKQDFATWNNFIRELSRAYRETAVLKRN